MKVVADWVCPAHAGIHRCRPVPPIFDLGLPRTRGDTPPLKLLTEPSGSFAPHTRGYTL